MKQRVKKEMDRTLDRVGNGYRMFVMGDLVSLDIISAFLVPEENDGRKRVVDSCAERRPAWVINISSVRVYISTQGWLKDMIE